MTELRSKPLRLRLFVCSAFGVAQGLFFASLYNGSSWSRDVEQASLSYLRAVESPLSVAPAAEAVVPQIEKQVSVEAPAQDSRVSLVSHTVQAGETFSRIWQAHGAPAQGGLEAHQALRKLSSEHGVLRNGEKLAVVLADGDIIEVKRRLSQGATLVLTGNSKDGYEAEIQRARLIESERTINGTVGSSFSAAAADLDLPYALVDDFVDLFSNRVEFRKDINYGDSFSVIYTEQTSEDGEYRSAGIIRAASLKLGDKFFAVVRDVDDDGTVRYYDERGQVPGNSFLRYPVQFSRISSVFSGARFHPVLHKTRAHNGVDFSAPTGTPVRTVGDGVVVKAGFFSGTGNMVRIQHCGRYTTEYMHLSKIAGGLEVGAKVSRGQVIGNVGMTGLASGPHLHFGLFDNGTYVDPLQSEVSVETPQKDPSPAILATLRELRNNHAVISVASNESAKRRA